MESDEGIDRVLARIEAGEAGMHELVQPLHGELRRLAGGFMRKERRDHTLQPTALVNEAYLRCAKAAPCMARTRTEFLALAARVMRNTLVDHARARAADKRRAPRSQVSLTGLEKRAPEDPVDVLALHEALERLAELDPRQAEILELSAFGGLTGQEIAERLGVHRNTVVSELRMGRAWLRRELDEA